MIQCPTCKQELETGVRFCPHDGTPLTETSAASPTRTPTAPTKTEPPPVKEIELPITVGGRYRLIELRGGGGMAKVYRAVDETLDREVAVKLINAELRSESEFDQRFQREARIASQLSDPHIIVVHDFGIDATHGPFLVMEYLQGQSLRERLQSEGPLPFKAALQLSAQLLLALIHAHSKNIVHRDIKPDNVFLLNQSGVRLHVRVLDFGIARIFRRGEAGNAETLTNPGAVLGTPRYMSPEQLAGQTVEARSDLYSAALVIHEAITGHLPYVSGKNLCELCPEAPPVLQTLLDECLKPNPTERPPTAVEVYLRLQELGKASGILLLPPGAMDKLIASRQSAEPTILYTPPALARWRRHRRILIGTMLLLVLLGLAALGKTLFFKTPMDAQGESLLGVKIGDAQQDVVGRLHLTKGGPMNPWAREHLPGYLGNVLREKDLGLPKDALPHLDVQRSPDDIVCVVFHEDKVRAVVWGGSHSGYTGRGVKVGSPIRRIFELYPEAPSEDGPRKVIGPKNENRHIEIRRYDALGIGFEMYEGKVTAITLYPPINDP